MATADVHELSAAYALDAVDDIERAAFTRHLAECAECVAEVARFQNIADLLLELPAQQPPAELRASLLDTASRAVPAEPARSLGGSATRAERRWRRATVATIAAAVLAVVGTWAVMDQRLRDERSQVRALRTDRERIYAVMNARDVVMRGADLPGGGRVAAAVSTVERGGVAMLAGLVRPPAGAVYQMWLMAGQQATSALVLPAGLSGGTMLFQHWSPGADAVGISFEPAGGSDSPTMALLATFALT